MSSARSSFHRLGLCLPLLALLAACAGSSGGSAAQPAEARLTFWAKVGADAPVGAIAGQNACGKTYAVVTKRVPQNDPALEPAEVHQIDDEANILRSWSTPVNLVPVAVDGSAILLRREPDDGAILQIGVDGSIATRSIPTLVRPAPMACPPRPLDQYAADTLCVTVSDLSSRKKLLLEFEEPCL